MKKIQIVLIGLLLGLIGGLVQAQAWQADGLVKLVVPFPPGGPTDALARRLAHGLSQELGSTVVVENRAGAGGNIGAESVATAAPDGKTILFGTSGPLAINRSLYPGLRYDPLQDFSPVLRIGYLPNVLVVRADLPVNSVQELIAYEKSHPNQLTYASSGNGASSHLAGVLFNRMAGTAILHVPYRGTGPALTDLLGRQVDMTFTDIMMALPHIQRGALKAIGVLTKDRSPVLPDLPSIAEQGLEGYDVSVFFGLVTPKGTPERITQALNAAFVNVLGHEEVRNTLLSQGIVLADDTSAAGLRDFMTAEIEKWNAIIQEEHIVLE